MSAQIFSSDTLVKPNWDSQREEAARERLRALSTGRPLDRVPLLFIPDGGPATPTHDILALDDAAAYNHMVSAMNHVLASFPEGDYLPHFTNTELGQGIVPSLFGLEVVVEAKQAPYNTARLAMDLEADLAKIPERIDPERDGWGPRLKKRIQFFLEASDGKIPVAVADHQSPYGVATKLVGNEALMYAMFDAPELVHELMRRTTLAISDLLHAMQRWVGDPSRLVLNTSMPIPEGGLILWDDYISVISPAQHREFCLPYNLQLYREFGFGHLHTCGPVFPTYVDALLAHEGIKSIDISTYLGQTSHTREELLDLRERTRARGISLRGGLSTTPVVNFHGDATPPDAALVAQMARGGLVIHGWGPRQKGLELLEWARMAQEREIN